MLRASAAQPISLRRVSVHMGGAGKRQAAGLGTRQQQETEMSDQEPLSSTGGVSDASVDETARLIASDKVEGTSVYNLQGDKLGSARFTPSCSTNTRAKYPTR